MTPPDQVPLKSVAVRDHRSSEGCDDEPLLRQPTSPAGEDGSPGIVTAASPPLSPQPITARDSTRSSSDGGSSGSSDSGSGNSLEQPLIDKDLDVVVDFTASVPGDVPHDHAGVFTYIVHTSIYICVCVCGVWGGYGGLSCCGHCFARLDCVN